MNNPEVLREEANALLKQAEYLEWLKLPEVQLAKSLHNIFCKYNHTDQCSFGLEEGWRTIVETDTGSNTAHATWVAKARNVISLMNGGGSRILDLVQRCDYECIAGKLELNVDYQKLKCLLKAL